MLRRGVARIDAVRHATAFWRAAAVIVCVVLAYNYSLQTLAQEMGEQTPLAYLGLVPLIALLLAVVLAQRPSGAPDIHDRYLDYIVGVPLLTIAMGLLIVAPEGLPSVYWCGFAQRCCSCSSRGHTRTSSCSITSSHGSPTRLQLL
jgi:hypothetical protein